MDAGLSPCLIASASLTYLRFLRLPLVAVAIPLVAVAVAVALVAVVTRTLGCRSNRTLGCRSRSLDCRSSRTRKRAGCSNRRGKNRSRNTEHQIHR